MKIKRSKEQTLSEKYASREKKEDFISEKNFFKRVAKRAKSFFKNTAKDIKKNAKKVWKDIQIEAGRRKTPKTFKPGALVAFNYNAKHKQQSYDKNPLVIMLGPSKNKKNLYLGLNLHWLPIKDRVTLATFFVELLEKRKGELTYEDVKPFMHKFKGHPVLRSYYYTRVSNKVYEMIPEQYLTAAAVPSEQIIKGK